MRTEQLEAVRAHLASRGCRLGPEEVAEALRDVGVVVSDTSVLHTLDSLRRTSTGAGPLDRLLQLPGVTDILVNGFDQVFIDRGLGLEQVATSFADDEEVRRLAVRLAASVGRRLDDASPFVDARLRDGTRLHAVLGCLADRGTCLSLRIPARKSFSLEQLVSSGDMPPAVAEVLRALVASRAAFLISGGTGSGKTTLLATLLGLVPPNQRLVIVEDSRELSPEHPHCLRLEARPPNAEGAGRVNLTDLVRQALRMRPDRLIVGEVRGAELCDLLTAMNTGHEGGSGTVHANSVTDVPARLEALAALGGMGRAACHAQVAAAIQVVVHVVREGGSRRRVAQFGVIVRRAGGEVAIEEAVRIDANGRLERGEGYRQLAKVIA